MLRACPTPIALTITDVTAGLAMECRYTLTPEMARCGIASYRDSPGFTDHLDKAFTQFRDVLGG